MKYMYMTWTQDTSSNITCDHVTLPSLSFFSRLMKTKVFGQNIPNLSLFVLVLSLSKR